MLLFKTFIFQMAPTSRKLSYWSASQGVDLEWNQFRESSPGVLSRILKHNVSEKLANSQHVFLLHDYNWVCEWCSRLLSGSAQRFTPSTSTCLPPARIPLLVYKSSLWPCPTQLRSSPILGCQDQSGWLKHFWMLMWKELNFCFWVI